MLLKRRGKHGNVQTVLAATVVSLQQRFTIPFKAWQNKHRPRVTAWRFPHARHLERGGGVQRITLHFKKVSTKSNWRASRLSVYTHLKYIKQIFTINYAENLFNCQLAELPVSC